MALLLRLLALLVGIFVLTSAVAAPAAGVHEAVPAAADDVELVLFWGDGCPHCAAEKEWLQEAEATWPHLVVTQHEVWYDEAGRAELEETAARLGFDPSGVPVTVIGERHWIGWHEGIQAEIEGILEAAETNSGPPDEAEPEGTRTETITVPGFGEIDVSSKSLVVSTLVIGFVDGVNPCSLWVISVLLAIVVRTGSRRRVLAIGLTFLAVTAGMYALYMAGIYTAMGVVSHLGAIQVVVAVAAGVFGIVSIKDYFAFGKGVSFSIPGSAKPGIYRRMRAVASHERLLPALAATVVLAVGVSLLETPCTAGFPVLWTGLLEANGVEAAEAAWLFVLYMVPFLLDELLIFGIAVVTLRATKMQERHGRLLKLVAGTMLLALAITVLVDPEAMSNPWIALAVFAAAIAVAAVTHLVTRRVRPD